MKKTNEWAEFLSKQWQNTWKLNEWQARKMAILIPSICSLKKKIIFSSLSIMIMQMLERVTTIM